MPKLSEKESHAMGPIHSKVNALRSALSLLGGDRVIGVAGLATGSTPTKVAHNALEFIINGKVYKLAANVAGVTLAAGTIPQDKFGAYRLQVGADGTVDCVAAAANADPGYDSAAAALAGLPALGGDHASLGTLSVKSTDASGFVAGTTAISAAEVTEVFADATGLFEAIVAALPAAIS